MIDQGKKLNDRVELASVCIEKQCSQVLVLGYSCPVGGHRVPRFPPESCHHVINRYSSKHIRNMQ